ncbi:MAG: DUF6265 family protein [Vicinamibacteria bacterium]
MKRVSRRHALIAFAWVLALAPRARCEAPPPEASRLAWMEGYWTGISDGIATEEVWTAPKGGALLGMHRDVKDGKMISFEFFRIEATPEGATYFASPRSRVPTPFHAVDWGEKRVVFENKEHDFPQRILYWLDGAGALHARIEGPQGGKTVGEEWTWTKGR